MEEGLDQVNRISLPTLSIPENDNLRRAFKELTPEPVIISKVVKEKPKLSEFEL
jgi:hypothetical protein